MMKSKTVSRRLARQLKEKMNTVKKGIPSTFTVAGCQYQKNVRLMEGV